MAYSNPDKPKLSQLIDALQDLSAIDTDQEFEFRELKSGEVLFEQGEAGDSMYVLVAGVLGVRVRHEDGSETVIDKLAPGAVVGELALLSGQKRSATVFAINGAGVIRITKTKFEELKGEDREAAEFIDSIVMQRWQRLQLAKILRDLFGDLDTGSLHALQRQMEWLDCSNGSFLFRQGDEGDSMYVVINGRLRVVVITPDGEEKVVSEIGSGETVGEYAVLTDDIRSATVYAVRETSLAKISRSVFKELSHRYPDLSGKIAQIIVQRQQRNLRGILCPTCSTKTIALIPASADIRLRQFADELTRALSPFGESTTLNSQMFDELYGIPGAAQTDLNDINNPAITSWLGDFETKHAFIVFTADAESSPWTQRCINQADRILIIANPNADPSPGTVERLLDRLEMPVRTDLVLLHPDGTQQPHGTRAWLDQRQVQSHYHLRDSNQADIQRLARSLSGHAIALVLSGGGARGFSHLGVYRAMQELGIPIDYVGGTSFGALMGGLLAQKLSYEELMGMGEVLAKTKRIFDYTLPFTSLTASNKITRLCQEIYGGLLIEDIWCPFFCVSSNLSRAEPVIHRKGLLWRAVRASISIPGVFAPVIEDDEVLVDGGPMDNFPAGIMVRLSESDRVIGVQASPHREKKRQYDYDTSISGWKILFSKLNPFARPLRAPSLISTILRAQEINSAYQTKTTQTLVNLLIQIDVRQFGFLDFNNYIAIAQAGYEAALESLREWKAMLGE